MSTVSHRLCTAPMMDWSDRHCRYFFRQLSAHARVYTEMITTGALLHGDVARHLDFSAAEHPIALQLGGSEPDELARCAQLAAQWGYDEINLNIGCPSERVQRGAFGACLMREPALVADCVRAMHAACGLPITVKHRLGLDREEDYAFVHDFVANVAQAGCELFIVHARNAVLKGLSPKQNRAVPPLRYEAVYRLKQDFPHLNIVINGGIASWPAIAEHLQHVDGVMLGRAAYHDPYLLAEADRRCWGSNTPAPTREQVVLAMFDYAKRAIAAGALLRHITQHMLGLFQHLPGARTWRRMLSDAQLLKHNDASLLLQALETVQSTPYEAALALAER